MAVGRKMSMEGEGVQDGAVTIVLATDTDSPYLGGNEGETGKGRGRGMKEPFGKP